ncbi:putative pathogenesis associated protein Cap20 [Bimuria novae-zelandiae CBS 107.79]|uniref:Putative pathogenesis associated protein Cap20 n=1 Tax=Bimuria novae-zelandiae CBS 107.79 TaxID=1447943 RepID=A0A6A5VSL9_9PLEO|nr:putative pathogenesis associated protein Cap20 [Bimuria novae-zelandiae CBS 107.79]
MPHAEKDTNGEMKTTTPLTNGEKPQSKVLSHLQAYPVVHDSLEFCKSNPYGAKSLSLLHNTYNSFVAPLHPYLQTPYSYLSPYLSRADELGDASLSKVDTRFPIVKEDTSKLKETVSQYVGLPFQLAGKGREYLLSTWQDEYSKTKGNDGSVVKNVKALISTELKIGLDGYSLLVGYWQKGQEKTSKKVNEVKQ